MKCIICKQDKPNENFSEEHIFPDSIGGNIKLNCVCKLCNDFLGHSVDSFLVNHDFVKLYRLILKIPGKSGEIPNPWKEVYLTETNEKIQFIFDRDGNPQGLKTFTKIQKNYIDNKLELKIQADAKDKDILPGIINKKLRRDGLNQLTEKEIEKIINPQSIIRYRPQIYKKFSIDLFLYKRAIIKIAYELAYYYLGSTYLNDEMGELLRLTIKDKSPEGKQLTKYPIDAFIEISGTMLFPYFKNEHEHHIAIIKRHKDCLKCYISIFDVFQSIITVSNDANLYQNFKDKFIAINAKTRKSRQLELEEELLRIANEICGTTSSFELSADF
ncbi:HNH endonuclease [Nostoc punctiforme]|uniref:HNH endonuclease 5 domain-containing protein n=1 Tax=Nostoc punctiforme (strain ATCC 29133 / PCC 73102) TaxID=63737 RepID=B2JC00_NOSP7|nr:HNH endonuclease [Nostoc punctiforme]ACC85454.1 conserved hypothetical protein [Nostoc punctiforme PCC 73102]